MHLREWQHRRRGLVEGSLGGRDEGCRLEPGVCTGLGGEGEAEVGSNSRFLSWINGLSGQKEEKR